MVRGGGGGGGTGAVVGGVVGGAAGRMAWRAARVANWVAIQHLRGMLLRKHRSVCINLSPGRTSRTVARHHRRCRGRPPPPRPLAPRQCAEATTCRQGPKRARWVSFERHQRGGNRRGRRNPFYALAAIKWRRGPGVLTHCPHPSSQVPPRRPLPPPRPSHTHTPWPPPQSCSRPGWSPWPAAWCSSAAWARCPR